MCVFLRCLTIYTVNSSLLNYAHIVIKRKRKGKFTTKTRKLTIIKNLFCIVIIQYIVYLQIMGILQHKKLLEYFSVSS